MLDVERATQDRVYRDKVQGYGFLIAPVLTSEAFAEDLQHSEYIVAELDDRVVGFIRLEDRPEIDPSAPLNWLQGELRKIYWTEPHANIGKIAVVPEVKGRGVAAELLSTAEQQARIRGSLYIFSSVVFEPIKNNPSAAFHEKHGFQRVAIAPNDLSAEGYNVLYGKSLNS